jgi:threonine/homoserine/homoserine lactone efflux protein
MGSTYHFLIGFIMSFLGSLFPSMLNMTSVKISIKETQKKALYFSAGVSLIVIIQAYIAVGFSKILLDNPRYLIVLQQVGTIVFIGLSLFFFNNVRKQKKKQLNNNSRKGKGFLSGILLSSLNMFAVPFYFGVTSFLVMMHWYKFTLINNIFFVLGSAVGTFSILLLYAYLAKKIENKIEYLANQMDLVLGIITGLIVIINVIDVLL